MIPEDVKEAAIRAVREIYAEPEKPAWRIIARAISASRLPRQEDEIRKAALEEAARVAEARFTDASVPKNRKGKPYLSGDVAIWAAETIAASIRALSQKGDEA